MSRFRGYGSVLVDEPGRFRGYGQQAGPCWTDNNGAVNCPEGYHIDSQTGRVVKDSDVNWQPVVDATTGLILSLVNPQGQRYTYAQGQQPGYHPGAVYAPPKAWYEQIPLWVYALAGGAAAVALVRR